MGNVRGRVERLKRKADTARRYRAHMHILSWDDPRCDGKHTMFLSHEEAEAYKREHPDDTIIQLTWGDAHADNPHDYSKDGDACEDRRECGR